MRIIFFGSDPWFSGAVLEALLRAGHEVPIVVTKGDAIGKLKTQKSKFKTVPAQTVEDILHFTIYDLPARNASHSEAGGRFTNGNRPDVIVLAAFGPPFLPAEILNWPKYGCLNVHASLLPRWRGASPVFGAIANGDKKTGVSIMRMTEKIDLGPVLRQANLEIRQPGIIRPGLGVRQGRAFTDYDNRESLTRRLGILGGKLIVETLENIENGQINEIKQPPKSPTFYTHRLTKDSGRIDWKKSPVEIERFIRAVTPWPGAFTSAKFKVQSAKWQTIPELKILKAHLLRGQQSAINNQQLTIDSVQLPSKNPISWKAFLAGHPGTILK